MKKLRNIVVLLAFAFVVVGVTGCGKEKATAKMGDTVKINFVGTVDGEEFAGGSYDQGLELILGSGSFIDNFEDQIVGMKVGDTKDIKVTFPTPYDNSPELAGKEAVFKTELVEIVGAE